MEHLTRRMLFPSILAYIIDSTHPVDHIRIILVVAADFTTGRIRDLNAAYAGIEDISPFLFMEDWVPDKNKKLRFDTAIEQHRGSNIDELMKILDRRYHTL